jgi:hypothetical protein
MLPLLLLLVALLCQYAIALLLHVGCSFCLLLSCSIAAVLA